MSARRAAAALAALTLTLAACAGDGEDDPTTAPPGPTDEVTATDGADTQEPTTGPGSETTEPATDDAPEDDADLPEMAASPQSSADFPGGGGDLLPTIVRIGQHDDFDRVVFDLEGTGTPGYRVEYVEEAIQDGSGKAVHVEGDAILAVIISGTRYPEEGEENVPPATYPADGASVVEEVRLDGTFEGQTQGFIGLDDEVPFRVFTLTDPVRLVVDVAHPPS